jgi:hypothetical protein
MKKKVTLGIIAVLAIVGFSMIMLACGGSMSLETPETAGITLNISGEGAARALTGTSAQAATTFYEATFLFDVDSNDSWNPTDDTDTTIIRTVWNWNSTGKITLPAGNYKMLLMVGRDADRTLLGVGRVTTVTEADGSTPAVNAGTGVFPITADTTALTITIAPLVTNIGGVGTWTDATTWANGTSSFKITSSAGADLEEVYFNKLSQDGAFVPLFHLVPGVVTATWALNLGTPGVALSADYGADIVTVGGGEISESGIASNPRRVTVGFITDPVADAAIDVAGFGLNITVPAVVAGAYGMSQIGITVPVAAYTSTDGNPQTWYIRGGLNSHLLDGGAGAASSGELGGAVAISFGDVSQISITTTAGYPAPVVTP